MEKLGYSPPFSGKLKADNCLKLSFTNETTLQRTIIDQDQDQDQNQEPDVDDLLRKAIHGMVGENKIPVTYNINSVTRYPDVHVLALFASKAYKDTEEKMLPLPDGWKLIATAVNTSMTNGYFGAAFMHPEHHQIVIAHRGTKPLTLGAVLADAIGVLFNNMPSQMESACTFCKKVSSIAMEIGEQLEIRFQIFITGHSLGGWLAQITAFSMKYLDIINSHFEKADRLTGSIHAKAVVFDSPGCKPMLSEMKDTFDIRYDGKSSSVKALDITTYLSAPNLVNTCNAHVGTLFRIEMDYSDMTPLQKHTLLYTEPTHAMNRIVDSLCINNNPTLNANKVADWPQIRLHRYLITPIRKCWQYILLPFKIMFCKASQFFMPKPFQGWTTSQDEDQDEWVNFFRWATNENNYNPEMKSVEFKDKIQKSFGYWPIRYQTTASDNRRCNINVFTPLEQQFLTTYFNLRTIRGTFQDDNSLADVQDSGDRVIIRHNLSGFEIDENHIICDNLNSFIPYVQQLLHWHRPIIDATKAQISDYMSRKQWYDKENLRCLKSLQSLQLHFKENIRMELNMDCKVCQVIVKQSEDMRIMTAKIYRCCANNGMVEADCTVLKLKQLLFIDQQYVSLSSYLGSEEMTRHLFIIECQHSSSTCEPARKLLGSIFSELERKQEVRLIFVTKEDEEFSRVLQRECKTKLGNAFLAKEDSGIIWNDLTQECQDSLLQKKLIIVNGENKACLNDIIDKPLEAIDVTTLIKLIKNEEIEVGKGQHHFCELKASFADTYEVMNKDHCARVLLQSDDNTHFFISCSIKFKDKEELLEHLKVSKNVERLKSKIFLTVGRDTDDDAKQWVEQCRTYPNKTIYWVEITSEKIHCKQVYNPDFYIKRRFTLDFNRIMSYVCNTRKSSIFIMSHSALDESKVAEMERLYENDFLIVLTERQADKYFDGFDRYFKCVHWFKAQDNQQLILHRSSRSADPLPHYLLVSHVEEDSLLTRVDRIVIIAGEPGMGKSTTLASLAHQMKSHLVIYKDLRYCGPSLAALASDTAITEDHAVRFLSNTNDLESDLAKALLKYGLLGKTKRKVYVLFDGLDEINESVQQAFVKLLQFLKEHCHCHVWITARKYSKEILENKLSVVAMNLSEIGRDEQKELLAKFWKVQLPLKFDLEGDIDKKLYMYAGKILDKANEIFGHEKPYLLSIPLQLRMIAEAFPPSQQQLASVESDDFEIHITDKADLYQTFIGKKYEIYFDEKVRFVSSSSNAPRKWCTETLMKKHSFLAYRMLFPNEADKYLCNYTAEDCKTDVKDLNLVGLTQSEYSDADYAFIHRSFAEHFVAALLMEWLNKPVGQHLPIEKFLMSPILNEQAGKGIRSFLNWMMTKSPIQEEALMESYKVHFGEPFYQDREEYFVSTCSLVLHVAAEENLGKVIDILFACFKMFPKVLEKVISSSNHTALYVAKKNNNDDIVKQFLEFVKDCSATIQQDLLWRTCFRFDACTDCVINGIVSMTECYTNLKTILDVIKMNLERIPRFMSAARSGNITKMESLLCDESYEVSGNLGKYLISCTNQNDKTALHLAAMQGHLEAVKWLLNNGANVNAKDKWGLTPLHMAAERVDLEVLEVVQVLLEEGADVNAQDQSGRTALKLAKNKQLQDLLVQKGAKGAEAIPRQELQINVQKFLTNCKTTEEIIQFFNGMSDTEGDEFRKFIIIFADKDNKTSLHNAAMKGHLDIVSWLLYNGANVNAHDHWGSTPLHMAVKRGHIKVIEALLDKGADTNARDKSGRIPLDLTKNKEIQDVLLDNKRDEKPIQNLDKVDHSLNVVKSNNENENDEYLLALVAEAGKWQLVKHMIKLGVGIKHLTESHIYNLFTHITGRLQTGKNIEGDVPSAIRRIITLNHVELLDFMIKELAKVTSAKEHEIEVEKARLSNEMKQRLHISPFRIDDPDAKNTFKLCVKLQQDPDMS